jgi:hypothetical protein
LPLLVLIREGDDPAADEAAARDAARMFTEAGGAFITVTREEG